MLCRAACLNVFGHTNCILSRQQVFYPHLAINVWGQQYRGLGKQVVPQLSRRFPRSGSFQYWTDGRRPSHAVVGIEIRNRIRRHGTVRVSGNRRIRRPVIETHGCSPSNIDRQRQTTGGSGVVFLSTQLDRASVTVPPGESGPGRGFTVQSGY